MRFHPPQGSVACALVLVVAITACQKDRSPDPAAISHSGTGPAPTPAPPFSSIDQASHAEILAYARGLRYDTRTGVSDSQALAVANRPGAKCPAECSYGAIASIHPEVGTLGMGEAELKAGRVIGRIVSADDKAYEKFNLGPRDTVYVWADAAAGTRARLISTDPDRFAQSKRDVRMYVEPPHAQDQRYAQSTARFIWVDSDEHLWISCQGNGCCRVDP